MKKDENAEPLSDTVFKVNMSLNNYNKAIKAP